MTKLLIVESPGKLKTLRNILGSGWDVQPSVGHITELAHDGQDSLGFDLGENAVTCRYIPRGDRGKEVIQKLRAAVRKAQEVYLATDPDREGEAIAWHIAEQLKLTKPKRVLYTQITEQAVHKAIAKPTTLNLNLINAQRCRQCLDKLVGYRVSPLLWNSTGGKSAGRVQSATLHWVCQREREIQAFVPQDYWSVWVDYETGQNESEPDESGNNESKTFRAFYKGPESILENITGSSPRKKSTKGKSTASQKGSSQMTLDGNVLSGPMPKDESIDNENAQVSQLLEENTDNNTEDDANSETPTSESTRVLSVEEAERLILIAKTHRHEVVHAVGKPTSKSPPPPFITSSLQQSAASQLGMNPEKTMSVAQSLYEGVNLAHGPKGLITYMRTDSVELSAEFIEETRNYLSRKDPKNLPVARTRHRVKKDAQGAHEAIRPNDVFITPKSIKSYLNPDQYGLYSMIWRRAVASQSAAAKLMKTVILTQSGSIIWEARGMMVEFPGYTFYWNNLEQALQLPTLKKKQKLALRHADHEARQTQPPPRYTEARLVQLMEKKGIGRPSTYASTIKTLKERLYIALKGKILNPTPLGMETDQILTDVLPDLVSSDFTAAMENTLDAIAEGKQAWERYLIDWSRGYLQPELEKARIRIRQLFPNKLSRPYQKSKVVSQDASDESLSGKKNYAGKKYSEKPHASGDHSQASSDKRPSPKLTDIACPICKQKMEIYFYFKDGKEKQLLRCSDAEARENQSHENGVFFQSRGKWWNPTHGELNG